MSAESGLVRVKPQLVRHSDGWSVGGAGRYAMRYEDDERCVDVPVDHGATTTVVHVDEMQRVGDDGERVPLTAAERDLVLPRLLLGVGDLTEGSFRVEGAAG